MSTVEVTVALPEALVEDARQMDLLTSESIAELLQVEIERRRTESEAEAAWGDAVLTQPLGDALHSDGTVDLDSLDAKTAIFKLDEL